MDRRSFLKTTGAAATAGATFAAPAAGAVAAPAIASGARWLTVRIGWPDAAAGPADDARRLLARIVEASEGRIGFHVVPADAASGPALEAVASGDADLYVASDNDHVGVDPAFGYFAGLPGGMGLAPGVLDAWLAVGGGQMLWDDLAGEHGVKPLLAGHMGAPAGLWSAAPVADVTAFAGSVVAAAGLTAEVARGLGAEPVACHPGFAAAGYLPFAQGTGLATDLALGRPKAARHYYAGGLAPAGATVTLAVSRRLWDDMAGSDHALLAGVASQAWRESIGAHLAHARPARDALRQAHGIAVEALPSEVAGQIGRIGEAVVAHAAGSSARASAIGASHMAFLAFAGINLSSRPTS